MAVIYTIGHSNRSKNEFIKILKKFEIQVLIDVRRFPTSKFEHFRRENLIKHLADVGISYFWFKDLGGYRKKIMDKSPNVAIRSLGFRNYADYMMTERFKSEIKKMERIIGEKKAVIMCAEKLYWKCHRKFISDYLTYLGHTVLHIINGKVRRHKLSKEARICENGLIYDVKILKDD